MNDETAADVPEGELLPEAQPEDLLLRERLANGDSLSAEQLDRLAEVLQSGTPVPLRPDYQTGYQHGLDAGRETARQAAFMEGYAAGQHAGIHADSPPDPSPAGTAPRWPPLSVLVLGTLGGLAAVAAYRYARTRLALDAPAAPPELVVSEA